VVFLVMLGAALLVLLVMRRADPSPRFAFLQAGTVEHVATARALLVREESILTAPAEGVVKPLVSEGSRVAAGTRVVLVIGEGKETVLQEIRTLEQQIASLQRELMLQGKGQGASAIFDETDQEVSILADLIRKDAAVGSLAHMEAYASSISVLLERRTTRLMAIDFRDSRLLRLHEEKAEKEEALGLDAGSCVAQRPGTVQFSLDGLETDLFPGLLDTIEPGGIAAFLQMGTRRHLQEIPVAGGEPVARIVEGMYQYLAVLLPGVGPDALSVGTLQEVRLPSEGIVLSPCRVTRSEITQEGLFVVMRTDRHLDRLAGNRTLDVEMVSSSTTGLQVPLAALTERDRDEGTASLHLVSGGIVKKIRVRVLDEDRESAVLEPIGSDSGLVAYAMYLMNPGSLEEGEAIG